MVGIFRVEFCLEVGIPTMLDQYADYLSWNLLDMGVQKALMTPHVASSDMVLQLGQANTMRGVV